MKKWLMVIFAVVLGACSEPPGSTGSDDLALPEPMAQPRNIYEAVAHLPVMLSYFGNDSQGKLNLVGGTGTATTTQVVAAAARAGISLEPQNVQIYGPPLLPSASPADFGLRATLNAPVSAQSGQIYQYSVQLFNTTNQPRKFDYGANMLDLTISKNGQILRWASGAIVPAIGYTLTCPPLQVCQGELSGQVPLDRFNPRLKLPAGTYDVTFMLNGLGESSDNPSRVNVFSLLLPKTQLTVLP